VSIMVVVVVDVGRKGIAMQTFRDGYYVTPLPTITYTSENVFNRVANKTHKADKQYAKANA
jgi:hypothetical protein